MARSKQKPSLTTLGALTTFVFSLWPCVSFSSVVNALLLSIPARWQLIIIVLSSNITLFSDVPLTTPSDVGHQLLSVSSPAASFISFSDGVSSKEDRSVLLPAVFPLLGRIFERYKKFYIIQSLSKWMSEQILFFTLIFLKCLNNVYLSHSCILELSIYVTIINTF